MAKFHRNFMSRHINGYCSLKKNMGSHAPRQQANSRRGSQDHNLFIYSFGYREYTRKTLAGENEIGHFFSFRRRSQQKKDKLET